MLKANNIVVVCFIFMGLSACSAALSPYDTEFGCKNTDHGGCEHPRVAYERAKREGSLGSADGLGRKTKDVEQHSLDLGDQSISPQKSYEDAVYGDLTRLISSANTPIIAPAKHVRTLILPYTDPENAQRLFMGRYIISLVEKPRFVVGGYLNPKKSGSFSDSIISSGLSKRSDRKE